MPVRFAIPKGSLEEATFLMIEEAWGDVKGRGRTYRVKVPDPEISIKILRPQEIPTYIQEGMYDVGITGKDWIKETNADVNVLLDLEYGHVKLVVAVPKEQGYNSLSELIESYYKTNKVLKISTEYLNIVSSYISNNEVYKKYYSNKKPLLITPWWRGGDNPMVQVLLSFGATEAKPPEDCDAIVDITETGTTLEQNNLKPIEVVLESSAVLIANKESLNDPYKREKIYDILTLLKGVVEGRKKLHIFVNVKEENLDKLLSILPALKKPTISMLSEKGWYGVNTVISKDEFLKLVPKLRSLAQGLVVHKPKLILPLEEIVKNNKC